MIPKTSGVLSVLLGFYCAFEKFSVVNYRRFLYCIQEKVSVVHLGEDYLLCISLPMSKQIN